MPFIQMFILLYAKIDQYIMLFSMVKKNALQMTSMSSFPHFILPSVYVRMYNDPLKELSGLNQTEALFV